MLQTHFKLHQSVIKLDTLHTHSFGTAAVYLETVESIFTFNTHNFPLNKSIQIYTYFASVFSFIIIWTKTYTCLWSNYNLSLCIILKKKYIYKHFYLLLKLLLHLYLIYYCNHFGLCYIHSYSRILITGFSIVVLLLLK